MNIAVIFRVFFSPACHRRANTIGIEIETGARHVPD